MVFTLPVRRFFLMRLHMLLAGFLLPLALLYFGSGLLYTLDIKGCVEKQEIVLNLEHAFKPDLDQLLQLSMNALQERHLPLPDSEPTLKLNKKGQYVFHWSSLSRSASFKAKKKDRKLTLVYRERSLLTQVMRIHRAEAGVIFRAFSAVLALGLVMILISGVYLALGVPNLRKPLLISVSSGMVALLLILAL